MDSEDKSYAIILCMFMACILVGYMFSGAVEYLEREHDIEQQKIEIKLRAMEVKHKELNLRKYDLCLRRTDLNTKQLKKECTLE